MGVQRPFLWCVRFLLCVGLVVCGVCKSRIPESRFFLIVYYSAASCPLRHLALRCTNENDEPASYDDVLELASQLPLLSLQWDTIDTDAFGLYVPTTLTRLSFKRVLSMHQMLADIDPPRDGDDDGDFPLLNLSGLPGLRDLTLDGFTLHTRAADLSVFSRLHRLSVSCLGLEGGQEHELLCLDPSTMTQLTSLHLVGNTCVDLRRLPKSLRELHVDLSRARPGMPVIRPNAAIDTTAEFDGPVMGDGGEVGRLAKAGDGSWGDGSNRAFCFDFLTRSADPLSLTSLTRLVFAGGLVHTDQLQSLCARPPPALRQLFFVECGMCEAGWPFESAAGAAAAAPALAYAPHDLYTRVNAAAPMTAAVYATILHRMSAALPLCTIVAT